MAVPRFLVATVAVTTGGGAVAGELSHDGCQRARRDVGQVAVANQVVRESQGISTVAVGSSSITAAAWASWAGARAADSGGGAVAVHKSNRRCTGYFDQVNSVQAVRARGRTPGVGVGIRTGLLLALRVWRQRGRANQLALCCLPGEKAATESTLTVWRIVLCTLDAAVRRAGAPPEAGAGRPWGRGLSVGCPFGHTSGGGN